MEKQRNIPILRFSEFEGEWVAKRLGDLSKCIQSGKDSNNPIGEFPLYGSMGIIGKSERPTYNGKFILVARVGANAGTINIVKGSFGVTDNTLVIENENSLNTEFGFFLLTIANLNKYVFGSGQPLITGSQLKSLKINLPTLPEQKKIATFLTSVNERIAQLTKKKALLEQYKKGVMQKIFSQEIRFKDDNGREFGEWRKEELGNLIIECVNKTTESGQYPILSSTKDGIFYQSEYFNREVASNDNTGYKILKKNQLVYSPQNLWLGNININSKIDIGIVSPSYKICDFVLSKVNIDFFKHIIKTPRMMFEYAQASEQGASVVRRNLNIELFNNIKVDLPSLQEQEVIANFLSAIDKKIEGVDKQLEQTKRWKKGLLQQMFC